MGGLFGSSPTRTAGALEAVAGVGAVVRAPTDDVRTARAKHLCQRALHALELEGQTRWSRCLTIFYIADIRFIL